MTSRPPRPSSSDTRVSLGWQDMAEALPQIVWVTRSDGAHEYFNDHWYRFTGRSPQESLGHGWANAFHPADRERAAARWAQALRTGELYEIEYRLRRHDGVHRWMLGRAIPLHDADGTIVRWFGTCTDIDELKRTQAELERVRRVERLAGAVARFGGWLYTVSDRTLQWSEGVAELLGLPAGTPPEIETWLARCTEPQRTRLRAAIAEALASGARIDLEVAVGIDDDVRWLRVIGVPVRDGTGRIVELNGALHDVTERRAGEHALRERIKELRGSATLSEAAHRCEDPARLVGEAAVALRAAMTDAEATWFEVELDGQRALAGERTGEAELEHRIGRGGRVHGRIRAGGQPGGFVGEEHALVAAAATTLALWSQRRAAVAELTRANERLVEAARFKDDLLSMASHELRTPLTPILGLAETLRDRDPAASREQRELADAIHRNATRMTHLVSDLLTLNRADAGRLQVRPTAVPVAATLATVAEDLAGSLPGELTVRGDAWVRVDPDHLSQLLLNLLTNAAKYGEPPVEVTIEVAAAGMVEISIRDHGAGVPAPFEARMWERFTQKDQGDRRTASGTGLGLAIVRLLAERNGGRARYLDAAPGARFVLELPAADVVNVAG